MRCSKSEIDCIVRGRQQLVCVNREWFIGPLGFDSGSGVSASTICQGHDSGGVGVTEDQPTALGEEATNDQPAVIYHSQRVDGGVCPKDSGPVGAHGRGDIQMKFDRNRRRAHTYVPGPCKRRRASPYTVKEGLSDMNRS